MNEENIQNINNLPNNQDPKVNNVSDNNLEPNVMSVLSYLVPFVGGLIFTIVEKENKSVRFHALQSILFSAFVYIMTSLIDIVFLQVLGYFSEFFTYIGNLLSSIFFLSTFVYWLFVMWKAYKGIDYKIPYIGNIASNLIEKKI